MKARGENLRRTRERPIGRGNPRVYIYGRVQGG